MLASAICATALVPALALLRDGIALADTIDTRHLLLTYGVSKMEEQLAIVGGDLDRREPSPAILPPTASQHPLQRRRGPTQSASGGITNQLMNVSVTAYSDDNGNDTMDASELRTTLTTKVSKLVSYESKAGS